MNKSTNVNELMGHEGAFAKKLFSLLATGFNITNFSRQRNEQDSTQSINVMINNYLDYGNYLAYGYAAVVLNGLGLNHGFPLLHGTTRRDALIFDVADLFKDGHIMPTAFEYATSGTKQTGQLYRQLVTKHCYDSGVLDDAFLSMKSIVSL